MITKERLEELIKEGATIYCSNKETNSVEPINLYFVTLDGNTRHIKGEEDGTIFETYKQAEWALKYHKTRTEELALPMWEEWQRVNKIGMYAMSFRDKKYHYCELLVFHDEIKVTKQAYGLEVLFNEPNTQENYEKACDLCLKLFNGEE